jgi:hypothetical protein
MGGVHIRRGADTNRMKWRIRYIRSQFKGFYGFLMKIVPALGIEGAGWWFGQ